MSDTMRDAFEEWDSQEFCIDDEHYKQENGVYVDAPIRNRWLTWQAAQSQRESSNLSPEDKEKIVEYVMNLYYSRDGESLRRWLQESM